MVIFQSGPPNHPTSSGPFLPFLNRETNGLGYPVTPLWGKHQQKIHLNPKIYHHFLCFYQLLKLLIIIFQMFFLAKFQMFQGPQPLPRLAPRLANEPGGRDDPCSTGHLGHRCPGGTGEVGIPNQFNHSKDQHLVVVNWLFNYKYS